MAKAFRRPHGKKSETVFRVVFFGVMLLTIISLVVSVYLAVQHPIPSDEIRRLIETTSTTWKLGFGATIGLIGSKALT